MFFAKQENLPDGSPKMVKSDLQTMYFLVKQYCKLYPEEDYLVIKGFFTNVQQKIDYAPPKPDMAKRGNVQLKKDDGLSKS